MIFLELLVVLLSCLVPSVGADLRRFDPADLPSDEAAAEHVWSARVAAAATGLDPTEVLAVAWHESRFTSNVDAPDGGARGCGVMTPTPTPRCVRKPLVAQYLDGATHLRGWYDAVPGRWAAFAGLAGGYALIQACVEGRGPERGCRYALAIDDIMRRIRR